VTAFLIESQKNLLPDPAQESVQLLRQIAAQSAGTNWVAEAEPGVDASSIWVNVFWFLSLVLSLTTALVGIVSLQWIRSHLLRLSDGADPSVSVTCTLLVSTNHISLSCLLPFRLFSFLASLFFSLASFCFFLSLVGPLRYLLPSPLHARSHSLSSQLLFLRCNRYLESGQAIIQKIFHPHTDPHSHFSFFSGETGDQGAKSGFSSGQRTF